MTSPPAPCRWKDGLTTTTATRPRPSFFAIRRLKRRMEKKEEMEEAISAVLVSKACFHRHGAGGERESNRLNQQHVRGGGFG